MIRIVKGKFLWFDGRRRHVMTPEDGAFRADDALEARLVAEGVAEPVGAATDSAEPAQCEAAESEPEQERGEDGEGALEDMTRAELADLAESYGIKPGRLSKAKLVEAIEEAEQAPDLTAAEVE